MGEIEHTDLRRECLLVAIFAHHVYLTLSFSNLQDIFLVKLPPRCDIASVNHKVNIYNQLLDDHFTNIESVSIIDTVPLENRFLYKDGLHLSDLGLDKQCRIILSVLYRKLAPELKRERCKRKSNSTKHRPHT